MLCIKGCGRIVEKTIEGVVICQSCWDRWTETPEERRAREEQEAVEAEEQAMLHADKTGKAYACRKMTTEELREYPGVLARAYRHFKVSPKEVATWDCIVYVDKTVDVYWCNKKEQ